MVDSLSKLTSTPGRLSHAELQPLSDVSSLHLLCEQVLKGLKKEFQLSDLSTLLRAHHLRARDLETFEPDDFMDYESGPRVWQARYQYYIKKKTVKVEMLRRVLHSKHYKYLA